MTPYRQAHRPEPRWRWYAGLLGETLTLLAVVVAVVLAMSLAR